MARLWITGFEWNSAGANVEMLTSGSPTIVTTPVRSGTYAGRISSLVSATAKYFGLEISGANVNGPYWVRVYLRVATRPSAGNTIIAFTSAAAVICAINLNSDGSLQLRDEDGNIGSASSVLALDQWYRVDLKLDRTGAAGAHVVEGRLDGTVFATASNRDLSTGIRFVLCGGNIGAEAQTQGDWYFDDIGLNDNTTSNDNDYPPDAKLILLTPNADGTIVGTQGTDWDTEPTTGGTAWQQVDELPPDDGDLDTGSLIKLIVSSTGANDRVVRFNLTAATGVIGASDTIRFTAILARVRVETASTATYVQQVYSNATASESASIGLSSTTWHVQDDTVPRSLKRVDYTDPDTAAAWTISGLDAVQVGVRAPDADPDVWLTTIGLYVEYVPATVPAIDGWNGNTPTLPPPARSGRVVTTGQMPGLKAAA